jgi:GT2 family glycosyltransferase
LPSFEAAPPLSVVMPVHNDRRYLDESVASILSQSFADFEFVIRNDGSTDGSGEALREWAASDRRIRLFEGEQLGHSGSANFVVAQARAPLIARMDADDVAHPDRLRRQLEIMAAEPDIVALGAICEFIDGAGLSLRPYDLSRVTRSGYSVPFPHASVMMRREACDRAGGYRAECDYWEDLDLYLRLADLGRVAVLAEPLLSYRHAPTSSRFVSAREPVDQALHRRYRCVELHRATGDYEALLGEISVAGAAERLHPMALVATAAIDLWRGASPAALRRVLARADLGWNIESARVLAWSLWASVSPASLRWSLAAMARLRNVKARRQVVPGEVYDWQPRSGLTVGAAIAAIAPESATSRSAAVTPQ